MLFQNFKKFTQLVRQTFRRQCFKLLPWLTPLLTPSPLLSQRACVLGHVWNDDKKAITFSMLLILEEKGSFKGAWYNLYASYRLYFRSYTAYNMVERASCRLQMQSSYLLHSAGVTEQSHIQYLVYGPTDQARGQDESQIMAKNEATIQPFWLNKRVQ